MYDEIMKLHIGCGKRFLSGFKHLDLADYEHIDFKQNFEDLSNFEDETVSEIYSSHALEYFDFSDAKKILSQFMRILKIDGSIFLSVPDFEQLILIYKNTHNLNNIIGPLFGKWKNNDYQVIYHKTVFDFNILSSIMSEVGFKNIQRFNPAEYFKKYDETFDDYSLAYFPHLDKSGIFVSLCITGNK